jgi:redox-sensing transcriptional repressor
MMKGKEKFMEQKPIPDIVIGRLPLYLRELQLMSSRGRIITSSQELGERLGISAAQIRKDLSQFGEYGKQGTGYEIKFLIENLCKILKVDRVWDMIVVGAGDIGSAIARYQGFEDRGFKVKAIFDSDPKKIGSKIGGYTVHDSADLGKEIRDMDIQVAMIAVPGPYAQEVTDELIEAGIKAILNYAPLSINVPEGVRVQHTDPLTHLQRMSYYLE